MKQILMILVTLLTGVLSIAQSAPGTVRGRVTTSDKKPAAGVNISIHGTGQTVSTDEDGLFTIQTPACTCAITVSLVGLETQQQALVIRAGEVTQVDFSLVENARHLDEVIVTTQGGAGRSSISSKLPVPVRDLPQSLVVIDRAILERQQALSMSDVLQNANGVYIMGTTGGYQEEIAARGYAFTSNNTFKNGARFNNGIRQEMSSVEKIEVLKGGSAILFGNVAAGGVLNIVTKKPRFQQGGEISFRAGSYGFYKPVFDVYGPLSKSNRVAYRLNGAYERSGSFRDGVRSNRIYVNPSLLFKTGNKTEVLLEGDYLRDRRTPDFGVGAINYNFIDVPRSRMLNVPWAYMKTQQHSITASAAHRFNEKFQLKGLVSYQGFDTEMFGASRPASVSTATAHGIQPTGKWLRGLQKTGTMESYYFSSVDLTGKFRTGGVGHTVLFGADADKYKTRASAYAAYANPQITRGIRNVYDSINVFDPALFSTRSDIPFLPLDRVTTSPLTRYGVYVQDLVSLSARLKLLAGVRYTQQVNGSATVDSVAKGTKGSIKGFTSSAFSPRLGVVYHPWETVSFFSSYTNTFSVNTGTDVNLAALPPSVIHQYEVGMKNELFGRALSANVTLYRIVNSNLVQTAVYLADGTTLNTNNSIRELTGETVSKGIEVDLATKPVKGFSVLAGYSYNDMRYTGVNGNRVNGNIKGDRLRYNPAHTANASVYYAFNAASALRGLNVGAGAFYTGDRLAGRNPTNAPGNTNRLMPIPDYTTVDLSAGYTWHKYSFRVKVSNVFNTLSYNAHDDNSINPIAPRQMAATLSRKF